MYTHLQQEGQRGVTVSEGISERNGTGEGHSTSLLDYISEGSFESGSMILNVC